MTEPLENKPFCPILKEECRDTCQMLILNSANLGDYSEGQKLCAAFYMSIALETIAEKISQLVILAEQIRIEAIK